MKKIVVLGNGQVWDLRGIDPACPDKIFEDVFCGRVLEEKARRQPRIFSRYLEKGKTGITGMSVTLALRDKKNMSARTAALGILHEMARDAGRGIEILYRGTGFKPGWTKKELVLWKGVGHVVVGGGVSRGQTGNILLAGIREYLAGRSLGTIAVHKARFPGKESGFLGAIVNILEIVCAEAQQRSLSRIGVIGIDLGRDKVGVGLLTVDPRRGAIINPASSPWVYRYSTRTVRSSGRIKDFKKHRVLGEVVRAGVVAQICALITRARAYAEKKGVPYSRHVGLSLPGEATPDGYLIGSTDYLPLFTKRDGFHFSRAVEAALKGRGSEFRLHIVNDGIAAGLTNIRLGFAPLESGTYAFLGPGSGLGGCLCRVKEG